MFDNHGINTLWYTGTTEYFLELKQQHGWFQNEYVLWKKQLQYSITVLLHVCEAQEQVKLLYGVSSQKVVALLEVWRLGDWYIPGVNEFLYAVWGGSYMGIYNCQNHLTEHFKCVHFLVCKLDHN